MSNPKVGEQITRVEQLDDLNVGSTIRTGTARTATKIWQFSIFGAGEFQPDVWLEVGSDVEITAVDLDDFPHLLLYIGGPTS
ncbi:hypothetical protein CH267_00800 [Rhodococcus sp. 06-621-2]|nr:hypothetical protein [Rhodococcus sp. 06-621-2]OZC62113.1 hypothetical protein CH267_00800 [Rhodococcus sp. 06-621-2]